jgi:hypothetical protein
LSRRKAAVAVARFAKTAAIGLFVLACFLRAPLSGGFLPPWFVLAVLAIILLFSARNEESQPEEQEGKEELFGYDFSQGYASLEQSSAAAVSQRGPITRWIERRREAKRRRRREIEAEEELRVDEILTRLHERGMGSLSDRDRTLLERVSERYRNRLGPRA